MTLTAGTKLGPYEITGAIGAGGMGEVYRARDAKLGRDVALKVLSEAFARDAERMARFQREAKVLASLDHPNIASIYGLEDSSSTHALVMQLVEGPTLADRIRSGPLPIEESLRIAKQMCEAIEYAHERGIVHRDLKPANVKVTGDDAVKILDFGLAKALEGDASSIDIATSPTISRMATQAGVLLGTAAYMSPEQAKGKAVDRRADIWGFGCVLYEMLTGKMAFRGESVTDTLAAVIKEDPDWSLLPAATPIRIRMLLQRCLQKDPKQRLQAIGDARISLDEVLSGAPDPALAGAAGISAPLWRRSLPWAVAALLFVLLAPPLAFLYFREAPHAAAEPVRFEIATPARVTPTFFAISPDGRQLAFDAAGADGVSSLWIRPLGSLDARRIAGSESTQVPTFFWSPDSRYIAFGDGVKLKKIDASGGAPETLCEITGIVLGGSWNRDGVIIFGTVNAGLMRVSANGGPASPLTTLDASRGEGFHDFPQFLPDGRHFIYQAVSGKMGNIPVYVGSLDNKPEDQGSKKILSAASEAIYVPSSGSSGQLLFMRDGTLMAQPFDSQRLELSGAAVTVASQVLGFRNHGSFSASTNGVLVYATGGGTSFQPTWFDRQGKVLGTVGEPGDIVSLSLSPNGRGAAVSRIDSDMAIWLLDSSRSTTERFTFGSAVAVDGIWSPDGNSIIFASNPSGPADLYQKPASGARDEELLLKSSENKIPTGWSRDGRFLLYTVEDPTSGRQALWVLPLGGDKKPFPFLHTEFDNDFGRFSPDGRWVAYQSDESGRNEIYVRTFTPGSSGAASDTGGKWLISTEGGSESRWGEDGKELYYLAADGKLMSVDIATNPVFQAGVPKALFQTPLPPRPGVRESWDMTPDGKRFLLLAPVGPSSQVPFTVVLNWQAGLKK